MDARSAAEARRQKVLARGQSRLAQITGTLNDKSPAQDIPVIKDSAAESDLITHAPTPTPPLPSPSPPPSIPSPISTSATRAVETARPLSQQRRIIGTEVAAHKWSDYKTSSTTNTPPTVHTQQDKRRQYRPSVSDILTASIASTSFIRLVSSCILALLFSLVWDAMTATKAPRFWNFTKHQYKLFTSWQSIEKKGLSMNIMHYSQWKAFLSQLYKRALLDLAHFASTPRYASLFLGAQNIRPIVAIIFVQLLIIGLSFLSHWLFPLRKMNSSSASSSSSAPLSDTGDQSQEQYMPSMIMKIVSVASPTWNIRLRQFGVFLNMMSSIMDGIYVFIVTLALYRMVPLVF